MKLFRISSLVMVAVAVTLIGAGGASAASDATWRVSVDALGTEANGPSYGAAISEDGRYVAYSSNASNLVPGDTNGAADVFWRDLLTGITKRVSVSSAGVEGNNFSSNPSITPDGRYVAFVSGASNLVANDTNGVWDIFRHDTATETTIRVSVDSAGNEGNNLSSFPSVSAEGRYVAFQSGANNLVPNDTNGAADIFIRDTVSNETTRILGPNGQEPDGSSSGPVITPDGRYVAFSSVASNLTMDNPNMCPPSCNGDIYVYDTVTGVNELISVNDPPVSCPDGSADISDDGRFVVWKADCHRDPDYNPPCYLSDQIFLRDRTLGTTTLVSVADDESFPLLGGCPQTSPGEAGLSWNPSISGDGRYVVFASEANNLVPGDTNICAPVFATLPTCADVFVRDLQLGTTERVSVSSSGNQTDERSDPTVAAAISGDGSYIVFHTGATTLVANDLNGQLDVFLRGPCRDYPGLMSADGVDDDGIADICDLDDDDDGFRDADETLKGSDPLASSSTPEVCDGADNDGDTVIDEVPVGADWDSDGDTVKDCLDDDVDSDNDGLFNITDTDDDDDFFSDSVEDFVGTDSLYGCPHDGPGGSHDPWPPDVDRNGRVDILDVVQWTGDNFGTDGTTVPKDPNYSIRLDINADGWVNILDIAIVATHFGDTCLMTGRW
jgi:Tol biopolymer transport system component